jgi:uncharacterized membrane protein
MAETNAPITRPTHAESIVCVESPEAHNTLAVRAFESIVMVVVVLSVAVCGLAFVTALASQENGRLQGELSRADSELRKIRSK